MIRSNLPIAAIIAAILLASCSANPSLTVSIAGQPVTTAPSGTTEHSVCGTTVHGPYPDSAQLTIVRAAPPVTLHVQAGQGATGIRGRIYEADRPTPAPGPIEEFTIAGSRGAHQPRSILPVRTYLVFLDVEWSVLTTRGVVGRAFRLRLEPP